MDRRDGRDFHPLPLPLAPLQLHLKYLGYVVSESIPAVVMD